MGTQPQLRYRLEQDLDASDPRTEWDHFTNMVCWHRRSPLGDRQPTEVEMNALSRRGFPLLERWLRMTEDAVYIAPLGLYEHSGMTMWLGGGHSPFDAAGWDSGTVGFIYVTRDQIEGPHGAGRNPNMTLEAQAAELARQDVKEYDAYISGDVYGYIVETVPDDEDDEGEEVDSCWGFYGHEYAEQEAKDALKLCQEQAAANAELDAARPYLGGQ